MAKVEKIQGLNLPGTLRVTSACRGTPLLFFFFTYLTLNLLTTTIVAPPSNASKWQMGFNSAFKGLMIMLLAQILIVKRMMVIEEYKERGLVRRFWFRICVSTEKLLCSLEVL